MLMEYNVQIIRGWPYDGSLDREEIISPGQTLSNGMWVTKNVDNTVSVVGSTKTGAAGLVIRGNGDSASAAYCNKAVVLWGNFIAQIKNLPVGVTFVPGQYLTIVNGLIQVGTFGTDPIVGVVLDVVAAGTNTNANVVAKFN